MSLLQELLNLGLVEIGSDDSRFQKVESASNNLTNKLLSEPGLLIPAILIILDDNIAEDDPFLELIEELLIEEWKTLRNTHVNRPRQLLRSILIDAVAYSAEDHPQVSAIVWNIVSTRLQHDQVSLGKSASIIKKILDASYVCSEAEACKLATSPDLQIKKRKKDDSTGSNNPLTLEQTISAAEITADIAAAAGPQYPVGTQLNNANPTWANNGAAWATEFTPRMAAAVAKAINTATKKLIDAVNEKLQAKLDAIEKRTSDQLTESEANFNAHLQSSKLRLDVLWWTEALYSPTLKHGYREAQITRTLLAAPIDLISIVPALAPASISYVLGETVLRSGRGSDATKKHTLTALLESFRGVELPIKRRNSPEQDSSRVLLIDIIAEIVAGKEISQANLHSRTGIDPNLKLTAPELSMWVFREMQSIRLLELV